MSFFDSSSNFVNSRSPFGGLTGTAASQLMQQTPAPQQQNAPAQSMMTGFGGNNGVMAPANGGFGGGFNPYQPQMQSPYGPQQGGFGGYGGQQGGFGGYGPQQGFGGGFSPYQPQGFGGGFGGGMMGGGFNPYQQQGFGGGFNPYQQQGYGGFNPYQMQSPYGPQMGGFGGGFNPYQMQSPYGPPQGYGGGRGYGDMDRGYGGRRGFDRGYNDIGNTPQIDGGYKDQEMRPLPARLMQQQYDQNQGYGERDRMVGGLKPQTADLNTAWV